MIFLGEIMSEIITSTYDFLDALDNSLLIKNLTKYKNKVLNNKELLKEIKKAQKETDNSLLIQKRQAIYQDKDYQKYMEYYNELSMLILKINKQFKKYTKEHTCHE